MDAETPAPSTVAFLYSSRFAQLADPGEFGMTSFADGKVVKKAAIAPNLGVVAMLSMRARSVIDLVPYDEKKLMIRRHGVRAHVLGAPAWSGGVEAGFSRNNFRNHKVEENGIDLRYGFSKLVLKSRDPLGSLIRYAIDDATNGGFLVSPGKKKPLQPNPERIAALKGRCDELVDLFDAVFNDERDLFDEMKRQIRDGLAEGGRSGSDSDWNW